MDEKRRRVTVGASRIVQTLRSKDVNEKSKHKLVHTLFYDVPFNIRTKMIAYPEELRIKGSQIVWPKSWGLLTEKKE